MAANINMAIKARTALLPLSVDVWINGQRLECRTIKALVNFPATGPKMAGYFAIELIQQRADRRVHLIQTKEALVA